MINTNKLFDLYYAAEDSEDTTGATPKPSSAPILTKPARSALIKRRTTTKAKRQVPARLKLFWDKEVVQKTSSQTTSQPTSSDYDTFYSAKLSPTLSSSKPELLPICLQASPAIDSNLSTTISLPKTTLQLDRFQAPQQRTGQYAQQSPQASFVFSFKSDSEDEREQSAQDVSLLEQSLFGPITYQHLFYVVCLGAIIAFFWTQLTQTLTQTQIQTQQTPFQDPLQSQFESPYFPSSSFTLTSATLTPSISAVRIFVAHQHRSQFSFTLFRTRLFAR